MTSNSSSSSTSSSLSSDLSSASNTKSSSSSSIHSILSKELQCSICFDLLLRPSSLVCGHTFCEECIWRWLKTRRRCPSCRLRVSGGYSLAPIINNMILHIEKDLMNEKEMDTRKAKLQVWDNEKAAWKLAQRDNPARLPYIIENTREHEIESNNSIDISDDDSSTISSDDFSDNISEDDVTGSESDSGEDDYPYMSRHTEYWDLADFDAHEYSQDHRHRHRHRRDLSSDHFRSRSTSRDRSRSHSFSRDRSRSVSHPRSRASRTIRHRHRRDRSRSRTRSRSFPRSRERPRSRPDRSHSRSRNRSSRHRHSRRDRGITLLLNPYDFER